MEMKKIIIDDLNACSMFADSRVFWILLVSFCKNSSWQKSWRSPWHIDKAEYYLELGVDSILSVTTLWSTKANSCLFHLIELDMV